MKKGKTINIFSIIAMLIIVGLCIFIGCVRFTNLEINEVYQVYLNGEKVGQLAENKELLNLIDNEQEMIKGRFGVDRVYPPEGLTTVKYLTYDDSIDKVSEIYKKIEEKSAFTILGYVVTIKSEGEDPIVINILNKEDLEPALKDAVSAFIDVDKLDDFLNESQVAISGVGKTIESLYFEEKITIKESYLPVDSEIITNKSDLTKYLLFGTLEKQAEYTVKSGDTVSTVAYNNKLSNEELLIANPQLTSVNSLLTVGQVLNIGLINPLVTFVEESEVIEDVPAMFKTITEEDNTKYSNQSYVKQEGVNGVNRITEKVQYKNGEITTLYVSNTTEISAPIDKIYVKGTKKEPDYNFHYYPPAASATDWGWPTTTPYVITSYFGYRWGRLHAGIDISGSGFGSPIYSATDGEVSYVFAGCPNSGYYGSSCGGGHGNAVHVKTDTGLTVVYAHIKNNIQVPVGTRVTKGQLLAYMGNSGSSTGTHLHFEIRDASGNKINPCGGAFIC